MKYEQDTVFWKAGRSCCLRHLEHPAYSHACAYIPVVNDLPRKTNGTTNVRRLRGRLFYFDGAGWSSLPAGPLLGT